MQATAICHRCKGTTVAQPRRASAQGWQVLAINRDLSAVYLCPACSADLLSWLGTPPPQDGQAGNGH